MNVPFTAVHFSAYETAKKFLAAEDDEGLAVQLLAGGAAGGLSAAITNPLDVLKTRMQTDGTLRQYRGVGSNSVVCFSSCFRGLVHPCCLVHVRAGCGNW